MDDDVFFRFFDDGIRLVKIMFDKLIVSYFIISEKNFVRNGFNFCEEDFERNSGLNVDFKFDKVIGVVSCDGIFGSSRRKCSGDVGKEGSDGEELSFYFDKGINVEG